MPEIADFHIRNMNKNCVSAARMVDFVIVNERRKRACSAEIGFFERVNVRQIRVSVSKIVEFKECMSERVVFLRRK